MDTRMLTKNLLIPIPRETIVIGFGHKSRNGKDTAIKEIIKHRGSQYDIRRYGMADGIKREVAGKESEIAFRYGIKLDSNPDMTDPLCPYGKQSRVLQFWGEKKRSDDLFHWVRILANTLIEENPKIALIGDCRYLNEVAYVRGCAGHLVKVSRIGFVDLTRDPKHVSEVELDGFTGWDYEINVNDGEEEVLKEEAVQLFDMIMDTYKLPEVSEDDFKIAA